MARERKSRGRQKIEMVRMQNTTNLQVTFSKRKAGLFKKASELCTLSGAEMAIIVFSPGGKAYSFGHPCVETVSHRFLSLNPSHQIDNTAPILGAQQQASIGELNMLLSQITSELENEQERAKELKRRLREREQMHHWWEKPVEELTLPQLSELKGALECLRRDVAVEKNRVLNHFVGATSSHGPTLGGFFPQHSNLSNNYPMPPYEPYNPDHGYGGFY